MARDWLRGVGGLVEVEVVLGGVGLVLLWLVAVLGHRGPGVRLELCSALCQGGISVAGRVVCYQKLSY